MVSFVPFRALRPKNELASEVAAPPYDVMNRAEAKEMIEGRPYSILRVTRPDATLDEEIEMDDPRAYEQARNALRKLIEEGILVRDPEPAYYIYAQEMGQHKQLGVVGLGSAEDYFGGRIKRHEFTLPRKEEDRKRQVQELGAHIGPVFLTHEDHQPISDLLRSETQSEPLVNHTSPEGIKHQLWMVTDQQIILQLQSELESLNEFYIADGHHRAAAASRAAQERVLSGDQDASSGLFLCVAFAASELLVLPYQRVVHLRGLKPETLLQELKKRFNISSCDPPQDRSPDLPVLTPAAEKIWGMYLSGRWYTLTPSNSLTEEIIQRPLTAQLDVSVLQDEVLSPLLGVEDPRTCAHIEFVGGIRGFRELERRADSCEGVAFILYPTSVTELMGIADSGEVMPPKSTWFEPKLCSGLFANLFDEQQLHREHERGS